MLPEPLETVLRIDAGVGEILDESVEGGAEGKE